MIEALLGPLGGWLAAAFAAAGGLVAGWLAGRRRERERHRLKTAEDEARARREADAAVREYRSGGGAAGSLHDGRF